MTNMVAISTAVSLRSSVWYDTAGIFCSFLLHDGVHVRCFLFKKKNFYDLYRALIIIIIIVSTLWTVDVIWSRASSLKLWLDLTPGILRPRFLKPFCGSGLYQGNRWNARVPTAQSVYFIYLFFFLFCDLFEWFLCIVFSPLQYNQWFYCCYDHVSDFSSSLLPDTSHKKKTWMAQMIWGD